MFLSAASANVTHSTHVYSSLALSCHSDRVISVNRVELKLTIIRFTGVLFFFIFSIPHSSRHLPSRSQEFIHTPWTCQLFLAYLFKLLPRSLFLNQSRWNQRIAVSPVSLLHLQKIHTISWVVNSFYGLLQFRQAIAVEIQRLQQKMG